MSPFASDRERRLWVWSVAAVVAIYSTLGLAGKLADELRDRDLLDAAYLLAFLRMAIPEERTHLIESR